MPLSINVGLSRKASKDFQSTGVSINVIAELDATLLAKPEELQQQVADLYAQAEQALDRQAGTAALENHQEPHRPTSTNGGRTRANGNGNGHGTRSGNGNGHTGNGNGRGGDVPMTASQKRAIESIARRANMDPAYEAREIIGAEFDALTLRQASELIDHLKSMQPAGNGR